MEVEVIYDDSPMMEREDRPRSRTWPILPPPIETIHEDAEIATQRPPIIEEREQEELEESTKKSEQNPRKNARKNAWGNLSYADLITQAIQAAPDQRLTLSQIYEWMVRNIPYFKDKGDSTSSAGWKNSIRHNLSLHSRFMRVQNDNNGKSSYWVINPDAKPGKSSRRRAGSVDGQSKDKGKRARTKKHHQSTDDIASLSPLNLSFNKNRSYDNLFAVASPCSSTDSLSNVDDYHPEVVYSPYSPYTGSDIVCSPFAGENFARPRSTSNVSIQSNSEVEDDLKLLDQQSRLLVICSTTEDASSELIAGQYNMSSINLNDTMKTIPDIQHPHINHESNLPPPLVRKNSGSFGGGDSGYESPAYFSPPHQNTNIQHPALSQVSPHQSVSAHQNGVQQHPLSQINSQTNMTLKAPPAYNQSFPVRNFNQNNFYPQQSNRANLMVGQHNHPSVPRLKHLPYGNGHSHNGLLKHFNKPRPTVNQTKRIPTPNRIHNGMLDPQHMTGINNNNYDYKFNGLNNNLIDTIPSDLDQVKLFNFNDQEQLAMDLNQIIENDLKGSSGSLQSICEPALNNNEAPTTSTSYTYQQGWVR